MVVSYENAKIYKIIGPNVSDPCYVGSTTKKYLSQRKSKHVENYKLWQKSEDKKKYRKIMSFDLFEEHGPENCQIILSEAVNVNSKDELRMKEQEYIDKLECINKQKAYCSLEERKQHDKEYKKQWAIANKDKLHIKYKNKYVENKDAICARVNEYRKANIDIIRERNKQYALNQGKATIEAYRAKTYHCTYCNYELRLCKKARHDNTKLHLKNTIEYMKSIIDKYTEENNMESNIIQQFSLE